MEEELMKTMKTAFDIIDTDKDGKLTKEEIKACVKSLEAEMSDEKIDEMIESCNPGGKDISFEQILSKGPDPLVKMIFFLIFDKNKDKRIDYNEFKSMTEIAAGGITNEPQLKELYKSLDKNNDGLISFAELLDLND